MGFQWEQQPSKANSSAPSTTSRALAGLIDLIRKGEIAPDEKILFWHTGGDAALHAYRSEFK